MRSPIVRLYQNELIVDSFAGGGGASLGIEMALGRSPDIAINHDSEALAMHQVNHPGSLHLCEDVWAVDPRKATGGKPVGLMWLSPDCKHHSKAKGGKPVDKKIRGLAWVAVKWAKAVKPRVITLENVEEFEDWGPLLENGRPCPLRKGFTFRRFVKQLENCGYVVEHRELVAADYGSPTTRKRLFLIARSDGLPIVWPIQTHAKKPVMGLLPWRTAAECIEWQIPCPSIFERLRPLAENTLRRIARGIKRYVIDAPEPFIVPLTHHGERRVHPMGEPMPTVTGARRGEHALIEPYLIQASHGEGKPGGVQRWGQGIREIERPLGTLTGTNDFGLVGATLIQTGYGEREGQAPRVPGIDKPLGTVVAGGQKHGLVSAILVGAGGPSFSGKPVPVDAPMGTQTVENHRGLVTAFLAKHYSGVTGHEVEKPIGTVTGIDHHSLVAAHVTPYYGIKGNETRQGDLFDPLPTQAAEPRHGLVTSSLVKLKGTSRDGQPVDTPLHTIQAGGQHYGEVRAFLLKYYGEDQNPNLRAPLHAITSRDRFGLVTVAGEEYAIADIGMRMLQPRELFRAQGFPDSYIIEQDAAGKPFTKSSQVRMCGNSVAPPVAAAIIRAQFTEQSAEVVT